MNVILATGGFDHKIRLWDATSGTCPKVYQFGDSQVNSLSISTDKNLLAAGGNPQINLFDLKSSSDAPILTYEGHTSNVMTVGFQKDGKWLYSCSEDSSIRIWDTRAPTCQRTYYCQVGVNSVALHPNQMELISGDQGGNIKVWDLTANAMREQSSPPLLSPVRAVSIASNASIMTAGSHSGRLYVYNIRDGKLVLERDFQAHNDYLLSAVISPDVSSVATTSADRSIKLWSTETWELERTLLHHQRWVWDAVFSADSLYLVTASSDQSAKLWDLLTGEVMRNYIGHSLAVTCVALNDASI